MFDRILIANRGEIACRVIRTCRRLGVRTVAVYSDADAGAQHVLQADQAVHLGGSPPAESYLRGDAIIAAALATGAQAIHPGYGFLSENAGFAEAVEAAGLVFIGPKASSMRRMGSKAGAKELMEAAGVPVVPGYTGEDQDPAVLQDEADRIGYPLMIKAAHGGGGKGMRIVREAGAFAAALASCQREAQGAFGRDRVLLERYVEKPRHIELQVFGDAHGNVIHLGERECSAQRRYQKVMEESPSPFVTPELRKAMGAAAVQAARTIDYVNAGTVEFIVDQAGGFYFMEINTRLQVEHPVTEMVTGLDLVEWQLRVASGEALPLRQDEVESSGHAIEVRLYAEDPDAGFLPGSGKLQRLSLPEPAPHVRVDSGVVEGDVVTIFYDPMIAKLVVHAADRERALARMRDALARTEVAGPKSNIGFLERLVRHPAVTDATIDTGYLDRHLEEFLPGDGAPDPLLLAAAATVRLLAQEQSVRAAATTSGDPTSPWAIADGWRLGHAGSRRLAFLRGDGMHGEGTRGEETLEVTAHGSAGRYRLELDGTDITVSGANWDGGTLSAHFDGQARRLLASADDFRVMVHDGDQRLRLHPVAVYRHLEAGKGAGDHRLRAPMPGRVVLVDARVGDTVVAGQELVVLEAMKMELAIKAPRDGVVAEVLAEAGAFVDADAVLIALEA